MSLIPLVTFVLDDFSPSDFSTFILPPNKKQKLKRGSRRITAPCQHFQYLGARSVFRICCIRLKAHFGDPTRFMTGRSKQWLEIRKQIEKTKQKTKTQQKISRPKNRNKKKQKQNKKKTQAKKPETKNNKNETTEITRPKTNKQMSKRRRTKYNKNLHAQYFLYSSKIVIPAPSRPAHEWVASPFLFLQVLPLKAGYLSMPGLVLFFLFFLVSFFCCVCFFCFFLVLFFVFSSVFTGNPPAGLDFSKSKKRKKPKNKKRKTRKKHHPAASCRGPARTQATQGLGPETLTVFFELDTFALQGEEWHNREVAVDVAASLEPRFWILEILRF